MRTKRKPARIIDKYVEVLSQTSDTPAMRTIPASPDDSLAYRAWDYCYRKAIGHFGLPASVFSASTSPSSSKSASTPSLCTSSPPLPRDGDIETRLLKKSTSKPLTTKQFHAATAPALPTSKPRTNSSPAILNRPPAQRTPPQVSSTILPLSRPSGYHTKTSRYTIRRTMNENGFVKKHKLVSSYYSPDDKAVVQRTVYRDLDWERPGYRAIIG